MSDQQPTPEGAQRRLQALANRGWTARQIEQATGLPASVAARALERTAGISRDSAARIAQAYDRLWDKQAPQATEADRAASAAATARARHAGWAPPLAWDDEVIDAPDGRPADGWKPTGSTTRRSADLAEDAQFVREAGGYRHAGMAAVAMRLGVTRAALEKAESRAARQRVPEMEAG